MILAAYQRQAYATPPSKLIIILLCNQVLVLTDFVINQFLGVFDHSSNWQLANCAASCDGIEIH